MQEYLLVPPQVPSVDVGPVGEATGAEEEAEEGVEVGSVLEELEELTAGVD